jgi:hypothetical protein
VLEYTAEEERLYLPIALIQSLGYKVVNFDRYVKSGKKGYGVVVQLLAEEIPL